MAQKNKGKWQITYRKIEEEEPLTSMDFEDVTLYRDAMGKLVALDIPADFDRQFMV